MSVVVVASRVSISLVLCLLLQRQRWRLTIDGQICVFFPKHGDYFYNMHRWNVNLEHALVLATASGWCRLRHRVYIICIGVRASPVSGLCVCARVFFFSSPFLGSFRKVIRGNRREAGGVSLKANFVCERTLL